MITACSGVILFQNHRAINDRPYDENGAIN